MTDTETTPLLDMTTTPTPWEGANPQMADAHRSIFDVLAVLDGAPAHLAEAAKTLRNDGRERLGLGLFELLEVVDRAQSALTKLKAASSEELDQEVEETGATDGKGKRYLQFTDRHGVSMRATRDVEPKVKTWDTEMIAAALAAYLPYDGPDPDSPFLAAGDLGEAFRNGIKAAVMLTADLIGSSGWRSTDLERIAGELGHVDPTAAGLIKGAKTESGGTAFKGTAKFAPVRTRGR